MTTLSLCRLIVGAALADIIWNLMSNLQLYNAKDTIATLRLWRKIEAKLQSNPAAQTTYQIAQALQAPLLYAMFRGVLVDQAQASSLRTQFQEECKHLEWALDRITRKLKMGCINMASSHQLRWLFACLNANLPAPSNYKTKAKTSVDAGALEKVRIAEPDLAPIIDIVLAWRDRAKMNAVLNPSLLSKDGRMHTFYKVFGTDTGRLASSQDMFSFKRKKIRSGMNMQNIKRDEDESKVGHASIRSMFIADPGMKFANIDLDRADSWIVALEVFAATGNRKYLDACASFDLHTYVSRLVWPDLAWTGNPEMDIEIAEGFFYRQYDYRFMSKKLQHGSNYLGKARTLAIQMKIPTALAEAGQHAYFKAFPAIRKWQHLKARELQTEGVLTNILGRRRTFHGRLDSDQTLRKAIAFLGQSGTAEVINRALLRLWAIQVQMPDLGLEFLAQVHDSILFQYPADLEQEALETALKVMSIPITVTAPNGQTVTASIPLGAKVGWNWANHSASNPDGLVKFKPGKTDDRKRTRWPKTGSQSQLTRRLSSVY